MRLSCRRNLKQDFSQSAIAADAQKRSYFSPVRCRQEVLFALWECRNSDSETSERRGIMHDFMASDGSDRLDLQGLRSLRVAELHIALSGGCLPAMVEFGCHYPSVGHAPKFREIVFAVSQNEHDFGVFLLYRITVGDDWNRDGHLRSFTVDGG